MNFFTFHRALKFAAIAAAALVVVFGLWLAIQVQRGVSLEAEAACALGYCSTLETSGPCPPITDAILSFAALEEDGRRVDVAIDARRKFALPDGYGPFELKLRSGDVLLFDSRGFREHCCAPVAFVIKCTDPSIVAHDFSSSFPWGHRHLHEILRGADSDSSPRAE